MPSVSHFYFEIDVKDSAIYLRDWQTSYLGSSARLICRKLKSLSNTTVGKEFSKIFGAVA